jgi:hypothetical protein
MDAYYLTPEQEQQFQQARGIFLRNCMKRYGFNLNTPVPAIADYPKNALPLGWRGLEDSAHYGYHDPPGLPEKIAKASQGQQTPIVVPPDQDPVFEGDVTSYNGLPVPKGGCNGEFRRRVNAGVRKVDSGVNLDLTPEMQLESLDEGVAVRARTDTRYRALTAAWQACMKQSGFNFKGIDDVQAGWRWDSEGNTGVSPITSLEIKTAVTDDACREKVNYSGMMRGIVSAYQNKLIDEKGEILRELRNLLLLRLKNSVNINLQN